jgi:EmrB/QacA subfamily drug resistance transporter
MKNETERRALMERRWWTLLAVCVGTFMLLLDVTIVVVALPDIQRGLHATFGDVQWVADAYALSLASLLLTSGVLADNYGRRKVFAAGMVVFTLGSLLCGLAASPLMLLASRAGQGIGGAMMFATSLALLAQSFHGKDRGVAFAVWGGVTAIATGVGPVLGGLLTSGISWRAIFLVNLPVGIIGLALVLMRVEESRAERPAAPDWPGFATLTLGLVGLVYGLIRASEQGWGDLGVIILLAAGGASLAAFIVVEANVPSPLFDLSLFRIPTFLGGSLAAFGMNGSLFALLLYLVLYLQDVLGYSALGTGLRLAIVSGVTFVAATASGRFSAHVPVRWLIGPGLVLVGGGLILMGGLAASSGWGHLLGGFVVAGLGSGLVNPPLASTAVGVVPPSKSGMASGVNTTLRQIGIAAGIATYGTMFVARLGSKLAGELSRVPALSHEVGKVTSALESGTFGKLIAGTPASERGVLVHAARASFVSGLNEILLVSAALAVVAGTGALSLIRSRDFVASHTSPQAASSSTGQERQLVR